MQVITTIARLFSKTFCRSKNRDMQRFFVVAMHGNATALPGIAHAVCTRKQEIRAAIGYITALCGRVAGRATAFPFPAKAAYSVG
jgi:hypothetical protein